MRRFSIQNARCRTAKPQKTVIPVSTALKHISTASIHIAERSESKMEQKSSKKDLFMAILLTIIPMILWGSLYPFIKIGYEAFAINSASIPDIIVFASMRFTVCGAIVCAIAMIRRDKIEAPRLKSVGSILLIGLFSIVLHYAFTYIGLSLGDSSKTALLKQLGALLYLCTAPIFIKDERFNKFKLIGSLIGFGGIIAINFGTDFSAIAIGDIVIVLASICSVISMILTKRIANNTSAFWATGISQLGGGLVLLTAGLIMGGRIPQINAKAVLVFAYICVASIVAYVTFFYCQRKFATSKLLIIKFTEPLFACIFGALLLGEEIFKLNYLIAFILICLGIAIGNIRSRRGNTLK